MQTHLLRQWLRLAVAAVAVFFAACGDSDGDAATARVESCELERSSIVGGQIASGEETASLRVIVEVSGSGQLNYTATITSGDWLSLSARDFSAAGRQRQGTVDSGENLLFFYYKANASAQSRIATFTIAFDDGSAPYDFELTQLAPNATDNPYDTPKQWPELPAGKEETDYIYAAHYAKMNLKTVRNYSLCFDKKLRVAHWVAYPLHASYIGSLDRSEAWAPDPKIPQQYQPALWLGGYQNGNVYNRGHQIPSKDRTTVEEMNKQTFYASNMTPQRGQFNQNMWAALEAKVRSYVCPDTLYVVTGCYFANLDESTKDKAGNVCPVPTNYFKVLLRTRDCETGKRIADCKSSELKAIGFWVANENGQQLGRQLCRSVAEIEKETGFTFFPDADTSVKAQNSPEQWGF